MRVYLAAMFSRQVEMRGVTSKLRWIGCEVVARWLWEKGDLLSDLATNNFDDIRLANMVISFTEPPSEAVDGATRGGRHVEFGIGLALGKRMIVVGPRENIFHHYPSVEVYATLEEVIAKLKEESGG